MPADTFTITADSEDGACRRTDAAWANIVAGAGTFEDRSASTSIAVSKAFDAVTYYSQLLVLRFDTSSLPSGAVITSATLNIHVDSKNDPDGIQYAADFYDFGGEPTVSGDWELTSSGDAITTIDPDDLTAGTVEIIPLTGLTGISKTGITGIRIAAKTSTAPVGDNYVRFTHYEHATNPPAELVVTYTLSGLLSEMLADSPNGCWTLGTSDLDESGNGLTLIPVNSPTDVASIIPSVSTGANNFVPASTQKFYRADGALVDLGDVFTLEAWVQCDVGPGAAAAYSIINKGTNAYQMALYDSPVRLLLSRPGVTAVCQSTNTLTCDGTAVYHIVCTKNGGTVKLYVNGQDVTGTVTATTYIDNASEMTIGSTPADLERYDGRIQMVAIYPTALSAARILTHYQVGELGIDLSTSPAVDILIGRP